MMTSGLSTSGSNMYLTPRPNAYIQHMCCVVWFDPGCGIDSEIAVRGLEPPPPHPHLGARPSLHIRISPGGVYILQVFSTTS